MFEYCLARFRAKAKTHEVTGMVAVLDADVAVVKSDARLSLKTLKKSLKQPLDLSKMSRVNLKTSIPDLIRKFWTLCIPVYFRSSVAAVACSQPVALASDCAESCNKGEVVPILKDEEVKVRRLNANLRQLNLRQVKFWSKRFHWLPCDAQFAEGDKVKITNYINNLRPVHHEKLYTVIENFIAKSIPLWSGFEPHRHANQSTHWMNMTRYETPASG